MRPPRPLADLPPLVFVKTHKTGGSTLVAVLTRLLTTHHRRLMMPLHSGSGWAGVYPFPGERNSSWRPHAYDAIVHHAVLDPEHMNLYLRTGRRPAFYFTILREPVSQAISALNYKPWLGGAPRYIRAANSSWSTILSGLSTPRAGIVPLRSDIHGGQAVALRYRNSLAGDLGWYAAMGFSTAFDHDRGRISAWVDQLERQLDLVLLTERFDEGLAVLSTYLRCDVKELRYNKTNENTRYFRPDPTPAERARLREHNEVNDVLYTRFAAEFERKWVALGAEGPRLVAALRAEREE